MTASQTLLLLSAALLAAGVASAQQDRPDAALDPSVEPPPATLAAPPIPAEVTMLRLRSGAIQWGAIEDHDPDSVTVRRLDTGGVVRLPWTLLESTQELDLRQQFGYVDTDGDEILIDGHKLVLHDGSELYGLIINYTDQEFVLKDLTAVPNVASAVQTSEIRNTRRRPRRSARGISAKAGRAPRRMIPRYSPKSASAMPREAAIWGSAAVSIARSYSSNNSARATAPSRSRWFFSTAGIGPRKCGSHQGRRGRVGEGGGDAASGCSGYTRQR